MELFSSQTAILVISILCFVYSVGLLVVDEVVRCCSDIGLPPLMFDANQAAPMAKCCEDWPEPLEPILHVGGNGIFVRWVCAQCHLPHQTEHHS